MTDCTPLFRQCVDIVSRDLLLDVVKTVAEKKPYYVADTFMKECNEVYHNLVKLSTFIAEVRPLYLQTNDGLSSFKKDAKNALSLADKNKLDEEFKLKVQKVFEKLKYLQEYEQKRNTLVDSKTKRRGLLSVFSADDSDPVSVYYSTLFAHRTQILRFLGNTTLTVNSLFERMQRKRYDREKQLNLLHFQNLDDEEDDAFPIPNEFNSDFQVALEEDAQSQAASQLSQQQIQELLKENEQFLAMKTNQFKQVEKLHHSMVDIVKLQTELTTHLETQAEQIQNLLDNQDQIAIDLRLGNRSLSSATNRNKRGSNLIITTCLVLGCLLLFVDFIS